jgi:hypothetical protein
MLEGMHEARELAQERVVARIGIARFVLSEQRVQRQFRIWNSAGRAVGVQTERLKARSRDRDQERLNARTTTPGVAEALLDERASREIAEIGHPVTLPLGLVFDKCTDAFLEGDGVDRRVAVELRANLFESALQFVQ